MNDYIYSKAMQLKEKYKTNDPFELLDALNATVVYSQKYGRDGLKGFCTRINRFWYVMINDRLPAPEKKVTAGHEAGHIVIHPEILKCGAFQDADIYNAKGREEREANLFAADYILDDDEVYDLTHSCGADFFSVAKSLYVPEPFLAFKLYSMVSRGYSMRMPVELESRFLGRR